MITPEKAIEAIREKIVEIESIQYYDQFYPWKKATIGTLKRVVPNNKSIIEHLSDIESLGNYGGDQKESAKRDSKHILESLIKDIERFGLEEPLQEIKTKEVIKVDVNQYNHQNQSTNISIQLDFLVEILKDELKGGQLKELKGILESSDEPEEKTKRFINKIKSFGSDVASNILANLLTNPQVYEQLGGLL
jgi:hypothetical protein